MKLHALLGLCIAALVGSGAVWSQAPSPPTGDGLVPIRSWNLDEIYLRPNVDLASYRKVVIDPVQVAFRKDWNKDFVDELEQAGPDEKLYDHDDQWDAASSAFNYVASHRREYAYIPVRKHDSIGSRFAYDDDDPFAPKTRERGIFGKSRRFGPGCW